MEGPRNYPSEYDEFLWCWEQVLMSPIQSLGWEHYEVHEPEPHILLFKYVVLYSSCHSVTTDVLTFKTTDQLSATDRARVKIFDITDATLLFNDTRTPSAIATLRRVMGIYCIAASECCI